MNSIFVNQRCQIEVLCRKTDVIKLSWLTLLTNSPVTNSLENNCDRFYFSFFKRINQKNFRLVRVTKSQIEKYDAFTNAGHVSQIQFAPYFKWSNTELFVGFYSTTFIKYFFSATALADDFVRGPCYDPETNEGKWLLNCDYFFLLDDLG